MYINLLHNTKHKTNDVNCPIYLGHLLKAKEKTNYSKTLQYIKQIKIFIMDYLKIVYLNTRTLKNKLEEIQLLLTKENADIAIVAETWVGKNEVDFYNFDNYNSVYATREKRGGGVAIFVKKGIKFKILEVIEQNWSYVSIYVFCYNVYVSGVYKPPSTNTSHFLNFLDEELEKFCKAQRKCILVGDLNIDMLRHDNNMIRLDDIYSSNGFTLINSNKY